MILVLFMMLIPAACTMIGEPLQEARYRDKGDRISRGDARRLVYTAIWAQGRRCGIVDPQYLIFAQATLPNGHCSGDLIESTHEDSFVGCADRDFVDREEVEQCRILIENAPCTEGSFQGRTDTVHIVVAQFCRTAMRAEGF